MKKLYIAEEIEKIERKYPLQGRKEYLRYDMNENTCGLPKEFVKNVLNKITPEFLAMYPEQDKFCEKYARYLNLEGISKENILTTNGSDMAIRYILQVYGKKGSKVVSVSPTFEMYRINCELLGLRYFPIEYNKNFEIKIEEFLSSIDEDTSIVSLINPNNPIGNVYKKEEVEKIIEKASSVGALVIIDEAYFYFYNNSFIEYAKKNNVIIIRTFSKLLSIAACRLGVIISNKNIIENLKKIRMTFDVNSIALLFGEEILNNLDLIEKMVEIEKNGKNFLEEELKKNQYEYKLTEGNFIFIKPKNNPLKLEEKLKEKKILVHAYQNELLKDYIRITTGDKNHMKKFLDIFFLIDKEVIE